MANIGEEIEEIEYDSPFQTPAPVEPARPATPVVPVPATPDRELEPV